LRLNYFHIQVHVIIVLWHTVVFSFAFEAHLCAVTEDIPVLITGETRRSFMPTSVQRCTRQYSTTVPKQCRWKNQLYAADEYLPFRFFQLTIINNFFAITHAREKDCSTNWLIEACCSGSSVYVKRQILRPQIEAVSGGQELKTQASLRTHGY
jgi:hypothetical protein